LKKIIALQPTIKILGSPWTAPPWMKDNNGYKGGSLKHENFPTYAMYFVKYIQAMQAAGITIDAITPQNEPEYGGNDPSMVMHSADQADFIKNYLGPAFKTAGITTKIQIWDHNCDRPQYPMDILKDPQANQYVDGSAFHLYGGDISAMTQVHNAFPDKNIYFTEKTVFAPEHFGADLAWAVKNLIIGAPRNWAKNVLQWDMATDANYGPHTGPGGCTNCLGAITIDHGTVTRNVPYYIMAHGSKFARPGSVRIGSNVDNGLQNVAFKTLTGSKVLIVLNDGNGRQTFNIKYNGKMVTTDLEKGAVATYVW
jgi:glucosylceramidase